MLYADVVRSTSGVRADGTVERPIDLLKARADPRAWRAAARARDRCTAIAITRTRSPLRSWRAPGSGPGLGQPPRLAPDEAGQPRRHHGGRRLSVADPAALRRSGRRRVRRREVDVHAVERRGHGRPVVWQGKDAILSGPAGGIVGGVRVAALAGFERIITFDMGGTSTERTLPALTSARSRPRSPLRSACAAPMMADPLHRRAGGGSILVFDGARFRVGSQVLLEPILARLLPAWRAAHRHRRQPHGRQARPALLPECVRAERRSAAGRRDRAPALS